MHQVSFGRVKLLDLLFEIGRVEVDVDRAGHMAGIEFLFGANIQNNVFFFGAKLFEFGRGNIFDGWLRSRFAFGHASGKIFGRSTGGSLEQG
jgi:hypothetical protein